MSGVVVTPTEAPRASARKYPPSLVIGAIGLAVFVLLAIFAPIVWGSAAEASAGELREGPSSSHWFGTDSQGRDVLLRTLVATRLTLVMGLRPPRSPSCSEVWWEPALSRLR